MPFARMLQIWTLSSHWIQSQNHQSNIKVGHIQKTEITRKEVETANKANVCKNYRPPAPNNSRQLQQLKVDYPKMARQ